MITTDRTKRAIAALKNNDSTYFHGDLDDYLTECLESLQLAPAASDAEFIKKELAFIMSVSNPAIRLGEMEVCIDDWCGIAQSEVPSDPVIKVGAIANPPMTELGEDAIDKSLIKFEDKIENWHLSISFGLILLGAVSFLIWG